MRSKPTNGPSCFSGTISATHDSRLAQLTFGLVLATNMACSLYASIDARGLYADGAALLVVIYEGNGNWLPLFGTRTTVEVLRQLPIKLLSRYSSATLFECGQVFTFIMLALPTILCSLCWSIAPRNQRAWILFPLTSLLIGYAATSMNAIGESAIATSYYWILLFLILFKIRTIESQVLFLLLCIPAFWLHEGTFPLTAVLLLAVAMRVKAAAGLPQERLFTGFTSLLLSAIFVYQVYWVIYPKFPGDKELIIRGLLHFEFLYVDGRFNLPLVTGAAALVSLLAVSFVNGTQPAEKAIRFAKMIAAVWAIFALTAMAAAIMIEQSFSPFSQYQARYQPTIISAVLGTVMVLLRRFQLPDRLWMQPPTIFILISLCAAQAVADVAATRHWDDYVIDLQSRLAGGRGLIPWEATPHPLNEPYEFSWVIPYKSIIFAPNGVVNAMIDLPKGLTFRPLDPERPDRLPNLRGIDFAPYKRFFAAQKSGS